MTAAESLSRVATWRDYFELTKPRVVALIVLTSIVGSLLASPRLPDFATLVFANLGIALAAASAAAINHALDRGIDARMSRTRSRPLPTGRLSFNEALGFALILAALSMLLLVGKVNLLTASLTFASLIGYAVVYTLWLKRATSQNIVIGGAAGAAPPLLGWAAVTGHIAVNALVLCLIIFIWTPPHFWALAIARREEYAKVDIPMLPVTHGVPYTQKAVLYYTLALMLASSLPYLIGMSGYLYMAVALVLDARFLWHAIQLQRSPSDAIAMRMFHFSVSYLLWLFVALLVDHYLPTR